MTTIAISVPSPAVLDETIVYFDEGARKLRGRPTRGQLNNWRRVGVYPQHDRKQRVTLEWARVGGKPVTSVEAYARFEAKINSH